MSHPMFEETTDQVQGTLIGGAPNTNLTRFVSTPPQSKAADADAMLTLYTLSPSASSLRANWHRYCRRGSRKSSTCLTPRQRTETILEPTRETARRHHPNYRLREHVITAFGPRSQFAVVQQMDTIARSWNWFAKVVASTHGS